MNIEGVGATDGGVQARVVDLIDEVLQRSGHVPEVGRRAQHEAVGRQHVDRRGRQCRAHDHLDPLDGVVARPRPHGLEHGMGRR